MHEYDLTTLQQHYYFCLHLGTLWVSWYSSNSTKLCVRRQEKMDPYISVTSTSQRPLEKNWGWRISFSALQSNVLYINSLFKIKINLYGIKLLKCQYHDKQSLELFIHSSDCHITCIYLGITIVVFYDFTDKSNIFSW